MKRSPLEETIVSEIVLFGCEDDDDIAESYEVDEDECDEVQHEWWDE